MRTVAIGEDMREFGAIEVEAEHAISGATVAGEDLVVEADVSLIQGIFGIGGEAFANGIIKRQ